MSESEVLIGKEWSDAESCPLDDIAAAAKMIREQAEEIPHRFVCNLKTYAYLLLGYRVDEIKAGIHSAINYTLPRFTFRDHLKDCFGFIEIPGWIIWAFGLGVGTGIITGMVD